MHGVRNIFLFVSYAFFIYISFVLYNFLKVFYNFYLKFAIHNFHLFSIIFNILYNFHLYRKILFCCKLLSIFSFLLNIFSYCIASELSIVFFFYLFRLIKYITSIYFTYFSRRWRWLGNQAV